MVEGGEGVPLLMTRTVALAEAGNVAVEGSVGVDAVTGMTVMAAMVMVVEMVMATMEVNVAVDQAVAGEVRAVALAGSLGGGEWAAA